MAYLAARVFLDMNGVEFVGRPLDLANVLEGVAEPDVSDAEADERLTAWLRGHTRPQD